MNKDIYFLGDYNTQETQQLVKLFTFYNADPLPVLYQRPDAAPAPMQFINTIPAEEIPSMLPDALANLGTESVIRLSRAQLERIGAEGDPFLKAAIKIKAAEAITQGRKDGAFTNLVSYLYASPAWQL